MKRHGRPGRDHRPSPQQLLLLKLVFDRMERAKAPFFVLPLAAGSMRGCPRLMAFLERIHARPAYRRALERGGEFKLG